MTKSEKCEFDRLTDLMSCHMDNQIIAKMGQDFHSRLVKKYGKEFAISMTSQMMDAVYQNRMTSSALRYPATGEVIEWA